ncbi:hypothetical protein ACWCPF_38085 [Streptomyces sp. NPDC001858]
MFDPAAALAARTAPTPPASEVDWPDAPDTTAAGAARRSDLGGSPASAGARRVPPLFDPTVARASRALGTTPAPEPDQAADPAADRGPKRRPVRKLVLIGVMVLLALGGGAVVLLTGSESTPSDSRATGTAGSRGFDRSPMGGDPEDVAASSDSPSPSGKPSGGQGTESPATATATAGETTKATPSAATTKPSAPHATPSKQWTTLVVTSTKVLESGQSWRSDRTIIAMESDGNLVIRDENNRVRWSAGTAGRGHRTVFQADGNLVVYTTDNATAWSSSTAGHDGATLVLRADGDVAIVSNGTTVWRSRTQH